jgi:glutamine amidotransferase
LVAVLDYGIGNLRSAQKALERVGADARLTDDVEVVRTADKVVLPGVGHFGRCMDALEKSGLDRPALDHIEAGKPFLGICVGMQLLFDGSDEEPERRGLGVVHGTSHLLPATVKRPQIQWNTLRLEQPDDPLFADLPAAPWMYFVHSFHPVPDDPEVVAATCEYGTVVTAAVRQRNVFATQFHPEKSGAAGLQLLRNFVAA